MKVCPWCQAQIPLDSVIYCPRCGKAVEPEEFDPRNFGRPKDATREFSAQKIAVSPAKGTLRETILHIPMEKSREQAPERDLSVWMPDQDEDDEAQLPIDLNLAVEEEALGDLSGSQTGKGQKNKTIRQPRTKKPAPKPQKPAQKTGGKTSGKPAAKTASRTSAKAPNPKQQPKVMRGPMFLQEKRFPARALAVLVILLALVILLVVGVVKLLPLLFYGDPSTRAQAAAQFVRAVHSENITYLNENVRFQTGESLSEQQWKDFCAALKETDKRELEKHLAAEQAAAEEGYREALSALSVEEDTAGFMVEVAPFTVEVESQVPQLVFYVDEQRTIALSSQNGYTLKLLPGTHKLRASYEAYDRPYQLGEATVTSFSKEPTALDDLVSNLVQAEIQFSGLETNLQVSVDGVLITEKPVGGSLRINPAFQGMVIDVTCDQYTEQFTLSSDGAQSLITQFAKDLETNNADYGDPAPDKMTNRQLADYLGNLYYQFYSDYLRAINEQNTSLLSNTSEDYKAVLVERIQTFNRNMLFDLKQVKMDRRSLTRREEGERYYVDFWVENVYNYSYRSDPNTPFSGGNLQEITAQYLPEQNRWIISSTQMNDDLVLSIDQAVYPK